MTSPKTALKTMPKTIGQTTLFLFAHQDDEIGVFYEISQALARGEEVYCIYLTNGAWEGVSPQRRNAESVKVLTSFGLDKSHIIFLGERLDIYDGTLVEHLEQCQNGLLDSVLKIGGVDRLIMHAFEGGHQDHDAAFLSGLALAKTLHILDNSFQFPLYRAPAGRFMLSFATPLSQNGAVICQKIPRKQRVNHLIKMLNYRSQFRVMLKIGAHMAWSYLIDGTAKLQPITLKRATERPNEGMMLYEYWTLYTLEDFQKQAAPFIKHYIQ